MALINPNDPTEVASAPAARSTGLRASIQRLFAGFKKSPFSPNAAPDTVLPSDSPKKSTQAGTALADVLDATLFQAFFKGPSAERLQVYKDMEEMLDTVDEVESGLFILGTNATAPARSGEAPFKIEWDEEDVPDVVKEIAETVIERCKFAEKVYPIIRETLLYGDSFLQLVVTNDLIVSRVMYMPPQTMVRNEQLNGLLMEGNTEKEWAFEQYLDNEFVAGFYPWQIVHLRWNRTGSKIYGRPLLYSARPAWYKLRAMEQALVINWVTRAFARLLFIVDVTGLSSGEAQAKIREFKRSLSMTRIDSGTAEKDSLSVAKDIFLGKSYQDFGGEHLSGLTDVKTLDTSSSAFEQLDPIEYYRNKIVMATRVPKAYFGIEEDVNAKATLTREDIRFTNTLRYCQGLGSEAIRAAINLSLLLQGFNPSNYKYKVWWNDPSAADPVEKANAYADTAKGDAVYLQEGVIDRQYIAERHIGMSSSEWAQIKVRADAEVAQRRQDAIQERQATQVPVGGTSGNSSAVDKKVRQPSERGQA
jgi:hypothetical protein